jgi:hypothetical protein
MYKVAEVAIRLNRTGIASTGVASFAVLNPREAQETLTIIAVGRVTFGPLEIENPVVSLTWDYCQDSSPAYLRLQLQKLDRPSASSEIEVRLYHSNLDLLDVIRLTVTIATDEQAASSGSTLRWFHDVGTMPAIEPDAALRAVNIGVAPKTHGYQFTFLFLRGDKRPEFSFVRHISTGDSGVSTRRGESRSGVSVGSAMASAVTSNTARLARCLKVCDFMHSSPRSRNDSTHPPRWHAE